MGECLPTGVARNSHAVFHEDHCVPGALRLPARATAAATPAHLPR